MEVDDASGPASSVAVKDLIAGNPKTESGNNGVGPQARKNKVQEPTDNGEMDVEENDGGKEFKQRTNSMKRNSRSAESESLKLRLSDEELSDLDALNSSDEILKRKRLKISRSGSSECLLGFDEESGEAELTKNGGQIDTSEDSTVSSPRPKRFKKSPTSGICSPKEQQVKNAAPMTSDSQSKSSSRNKMGKTHVVGDNDDVVEPKRKTSQSQSSSNVNASSKKYRILTIVNSSMTYSEMQKTFGCSKDLILKSKTLKNEKGILSAPETQTRQRFAQETVIKIKNFYLSEENSRELPGMKDCCAIKNSDGEKEMVQKRLVYCNLQELYQLFKLQHPDCKVGFSKFAELRPQQCILAGATATHTVCVCVIHQNTKLMIEGGNLKEVTKSWDVPIGGKHAFKLLLGQLICSVPNEKCYDGKCSSCPSKSFLQEKLVEAFDNDFENENIVYKQWISTDRCTLKTLTESKEEFISSLLEKLSKLLVHDFVATQQSQYFKESKNCLKEGDFIVTLDFSENFAFVVQEAVQGFHWNNNQATVHPFVIYYRDEKTAKLEHISYVGVSDCLEHDTVAVFMFQQKMIQFLKQQFPIVNRIKYFSDGAPQQYKNKKNFINILNHYQDFGISAEWNFFATAHGKGACDGVGGTLKREAKRHCLQQGTRSEILTAQQLFKWANENLKNYNVFFCSQKEYESAVLFLSNRFQLCKTIKGTLGFHQVLPLNSNELQLKKISNASVPQIFKY